MTPFLTLRARCAPLPRSNVDTEVIIPISRLLAASRGALGRYCFEPWRYDGAGAPRSDFPPNSPRYAGAHILISGANFGCGSSREAAVWALWDMGFRCIIAESFGDIFMANCFQNGLLPIALDREPIARLLEEAAGAGEPLMSVDLLRTEIHTPGGQTLGFQIAADRRQALLEGLDEIGFTLKSLDAIRAFQQRDLARRPWAVPERQES
jgi:3-isopropylmalate/(R)-2-methylmalate dehydratase small subunit